MELEPFSYYFLNHQNTESESPEIEIDVAGQIFTQEISKVLWDNYIHTPQYVKTNCGNY